MKIVIICVVICFLLLNIALYFLFKPKKNRCINANDLKELFVINREKYVYKFLDKSSCHEKMIMLKTNKVKKLFCQKFLYEKIDFLVSLAKELDFKINNSKIKYRAKHNLCLIEAIASAVSQNVYSNNDCNLFAKYRDIAKIYSVKNKENKIFKILLGKELIYRLYDIESEIIEISKIILRAKSTKKIKKYKKQLYFLAQIYAIKKYNQNSTKLLSKYNLDYNKIAKNFFDELSITEKKEKVIISYLIVMFTK